MLLNNIDEELTVVRKTERDTETYKFGGFPFSSHMNSQATWCLFSQRFCSLKSCNPAAECLAESFSVDYLVYVIARKGVTTT